MTHSTKAAAAASFQVRVRSPSKTGRKRAPESARLNAMARTQSHAEAVSGVTPRAPASSTGGT